MTIAADLAPVIAHAALSARTRQCRHGQSCRELRARYEHFQCLEIPCSERLSGEARELAGHVLCGWRQWRLLDPVVRVVSELAANAWLHGEVKGTAALRLYGDGRALWFEIDDRTETAPTLNLPGDDISAKAHGWGLLIVDALTESFGWRVTGGGKTVWAQWEWA